MASYQAATPPAPHMSDRSVERDSLDLIKGVVNKWSQKYTIQVFFETRDIEGLRFVAEFSQPTLLHPIPEATVKVFFTVSISTMGDRTVYFQFENESLVHRLDYTMQPGQYERWIDRILGNKLKVRKALHLGTEFEYTRFKDKKGELLDPFVGSINIMTATDLGEELKKAETVNIESPRFDENLRKNLEKLFVTVDNDGSGELDYEEFEVALKGLSFNLTEGDMQTLIAMADENQDGKIQYSEFIPIGIDLIKTFIARDKALEMSVNRESEVNKQALNLVMWEEINNADALLQRKFVKMDIEVTGKINLSQLKKAFLNVSVVTQLEMNIFLHRCRKNNGYEYKNFGKELFEIRYELARSRLLETNLSSIGQEILKRCKDVDAKNTGLVQIAELRDILNHCKKINLSPFQMQMLVGMSDPDDDNNVNYKTFAYKSSEMIEKLFSLSAMEEKGKLLQEHSMQQQGRVLEDLNQQDGPELSRMELFNLFKKYDENKNGFLDMNEYVKCLSEADLKLSKQEIIALAVSADTNNNGEIAYEEFMKHFNHVLKMIKVHRALSNAIINIEANK